MKATSINLPVATATEQIKKSLEEKGFKIFADIDHQANAKSVDLELPASRVLIFGNPMAGTKLMQKDLSMSLDLPLRLAIFEGQDAEEGKTKFVRVFHYGGWYEILENGNHYFVNAYLEGDKDYIGKDKEKIKHYKKELFKWCIDIGIIDIEDVAKKELTSFGE